MQNNVFNSIYSNSFACVYIMEANNVIFKENIVTNFKNQLSVGFG